MNSKDRTTLHCIINSTTVKYVLLNSFSDPFIWKIVQVLGFHSKVGTTYQYQLQVRVDCVNVIEVVLRTYVHCSHKITGT